MINKLKKVYNSGSLRFKKLVVFCVFYESCNMESKGTMTESMDPFTYPVIGARYTNLNNIPRDISVGYKENHGHVYYSDGSFLFYGGINIVGSDGAKIDTSKEIDANWTVKFTELPCDSQGNILMTSWCLNPFTDPKWNNPYWMRIMVFCSKEPTHRINLSTGAIYSDDDDGQYLRTIIFSYTLLQR